MYARGINRKGEIIDIEYTSDIDLEFQICSKRIVEIEKEVENKEKAVKSPTNRQVSSKKLQTR